MGSQRLAAISRISGRTAAALVIFLALVVKNYPAALATPTAQVTIFAPGAIPTSAPVSAAPAFTPDGNAVYLFQSSGPSDTTIVFSQRMAGQWSAPERAPFCGPYRDLEPAFAPNGKYLIFASSRPAHPGGAAIDGHYNGQVFRGMGGNLWRVDFSKKRWGRPQRLADSVNSNTSVFSPAVTANGTLYFMRAENGGKFHIYRAPMRQGKFQTPVLASFSDADHGEYDPAVAADESYLIFSSGRAPAPPKTTDLFIVFRTAHGWGEPIDLRSALSEDAHGIEARLSPDGKTLYFSNARGPSGTDVPNGRFIWSVDLTELLKAHGVGK